MNAATFPGGFTVLMAVYCRDSTALFGMAVESVFANTLQPKAFILVVDGPVSIALEQAIDVWRLLFLAANPGAEQAFGATGPEIGERGDKPGRDRLDQADVICRRITNERHAHCSAPRILAVRATESCSIGFSVSGRFCAH